MWHVTTYPQLHIIFGLENNQHLKPLSLVGIVVYTFTQDHWLHAWHVSEMCYLPKSVGRCRASVMRYYYNVKTHQCEEFSYGGCLGNDNRFETQEVCEKRCVAPHTPGTHLDYRNFIKRNIKNIYVYIIIIYTKLFKKNYYRNFIKIFIYIIIKYLFFIIKYLYYICITET